MRIAKSAVIAWVVGVSVAAVGLGGPVWAEEKTGKPLTQQQAPAKAGQPKGFKGEIVGIEAGVDKGERKPPAAPVGKALK